MAFRRFRPEEEVERDTPETWLGDLFGHINSADTEMEKRQQIVAAEGWKVFPFGLGNWIFDVIIVPNINRTMDPKINRKWNAGVEMGDRTWNETLGKFEDAKTEVTNYVNQKRAEIQGFIDDSNRAISNLGAQIQDILNKVNDAVSKVGSLNNQVGSLNTFLNQLSTRADGIKNEADSIASDLQNAKNTLNDLIARFHSAESMIGDHTGKIGDLISRVSKLEGKAPTTYNLFLTIIDASNSNPVNLASATLDNKNSVVGTSGYTVFTNLASGTHSLSIIASGYKPYSSTIIIFGADKSLTVGLEKASAQPTQKSWLLR